MCYVAQVFLVVNLLQAPISQMDWGAVKADEMVTEISTLVMPEVKNFAAIGIGLVAAYLLIRSFKG
jgi:hypothetical protein